MNKQERSDVPVLNQIAAGASQHIRATAGQLGETTARATEELEESLGNIGKKFNDLRDSVVDRTKEYSRTTNSYVSKNPWAAIGISAGVAFLVGILIARRRG